MKTRVCLKYFVHDCSNPIKLYTITENKDKRFPIFFIPFLRSWSHILKNVVSTKKPPPVVFSRDLC